MFAGPGGFFTKDTRYFCSNCYQSNYGSKETITTTTAALLRVFRCERSIPLAGRIPPILTFSPIGSITPVIWVLIGRFFQLLYAMKICDFMFVINFIAKILLRLPNQTLSGALIRVSIGAWKCNFSSFS